jgi:hypothetical protein
LAVGAGQEKPTCSSQLRFAYENHPDFQMLPTMGVTFVNLMNFASLPGLQFNPMMLLHGEHSLEVLSSLPTSGTLTSESKIAELYDKGKVAGRLLFSLILMLIFFRKAALVVIESVSSDEKGTPIFRNRMSAFIRGIGGWGGERGPKNPE